MMREDLMATVNDRKAIQVRIKEWTRVTPELCPELRGSSFRDDPDAFSIATGLNESRILEVRETLRGLEFEATSWIGRLALGPVTLTIQPKFDFQSLEVLIRYAYGLSDLKTLRSTTYQPLFEQSLQDLLVGELAREATDLVYRGLSRHYVATDAILSSPRGSVNFTAIARQGGIREAALPCRYHPRIEDWDLNRQLRAGLRMAAGLTSDLRLKRQIRRVDSLIPDEVEESRLTLPSLSDSKRRLTRLTEHYRPVITIIGLLLEGLGVTIREGQEEVRLPGFLFDMNAFWQRLLGRFLSDHIEGGTVRSQATLNNALRYQPDANPLRRKNPPLRPDFLVVSRNGRVVAILDAKYKDLWEKLPDSSWLYQMAVYSSSFSQRAIMLYPCTVAGARDQRLEVRNPVTGDIFGVVIMRPVDIPQLVSVIRANCDRLGQKLVSELVFGPSGPQARAA
jgi:5-methylcytosine-specific restriction enzyme subunit McrC